MKDISEILKMLPHRYPFLLVDRLLEVDDDKAIALKNVTINEPFFQGHFPGDPIMPGVLILEAMAQAGGLYGLHLMGDEEKPEQVLFMGLDKVKFRKMVRPGDQLILKLELLRRKGPVFKMKGEATVDGHLVAEAELMASIEMPKKE